MATGQGLILCNLDLLAQAGCRGGGDASPDTVDGPAVGFVDPGGDVVPAPVGQLRKILGDVGELDGQAQLVLQLSELAQVPVEDGLGGPRCGVGDGLPGDEGVAVVVAADPAAGTHRRRGRDVLSIAVA